MIPGKDFVGVGVGAVIVRDDKVLMLLRSDKCRNNVNKWTIPGGMVEPFEKLEDAIVREIAEETGLLIESLYPLIVSDRVFDEQHWVSILYEACANGEPVNKEAEKHIRIEWLSLNDLPENITRPSKDAILAYLNRHKL
ncbi:DNA mismatch repair protein MutT [Methanocella sp. CWC-04]|uniref:DNA mismatch repair protein MutT n=1 Tax=Methanooceanicella nereidis TaxID=2052831 RepID=A0AAP2RDV3_9EURY|nr:NUDIX domain-containing protein [Methanocella sp. CWC-04]MCD1295819.1 DNA mismatch repair protein MutT [Methanocella sp. CWC-04]